MFRRYYELQYTYRSPEKKYDYDYDYDVICDSAILENNPEVIYEYREKEGNATLYRAMVPFKEINGYPKFLGRVYYDNGNVRYEGILQAKGLYKGRFYYPSGALKFQGNYSESGAIGGFAGVPYPIEGEYYSEDGRLLYKGKFTIRRIGSVGYPKVIYPDTWYVE